MMFVTKEEKRKKKTVSLKAVSGIAVAAFLFGAAAGGIGYAATNCPADTAKTEMPEASVGTEARVDVPGVFLFEKERALQAYLDETLIPRYGIADLRAQTRELTAEERNATRKNGPLWTEVSGVAGTNFLDLDNDGMREMVVFLLEKSEITMHVYEVTEMGVHRSGLGAWERPADLGQFDYFWAVLPAEDGTNYVFFCDNYHGIIRNYDFNNAMLYRYNGESLHNVLKIKETYTGSGDSIYTAYQYQEDGSLISEEVIYDGSDDWPEEGRLAHYRSKVRELFDRYGLSLGREAALNNGQGVYRAITKGNGYQPLLQLNMWVEEQEESADVYHYNEADDLQLLYLHFLEGKEKVYIREGVGEDVLYWYDDDPNTTWTMRKLVDLVRDYYMEGSGRWPYVEYTWVDCGGDGVEELAIRFVGIGIEMEGDDSDLTMVITCRNGRLEVVYARESWSRSSNTLYYHGGISYRGSDSAYSSSYGREYIDKNGDLQLVYNADRTGLQGWYMRDLPSYDEAYESEPVCTETIYQIGETEYMVLEYWDDIPKQLCREHRDYMEQNAGQQRQIVTEETIDALVGQRAAELGIERAWMEEEDLTWRFCRW